MSVLAKIPLNPLIRDWRSAFTIGRHCIHVSSIFTRCVCKSRTVSTTMLMVTAYSLSVMSVASKILRELKSIPYTGSTHSRTLWPRAVRTCICLKVLFQRVLFAVEIVLVESNAASNLSLNCELLCNRDEQRDVLAMAREMSLTSFMPSFTTNCREWAKQEIGSPDDQGGYHHGFPPHSRCHLTAVVACEL